MRKVFDRNTSICSGVALGGSSAFRFSSSSFMISCIYAKDL